MKALTLIKKALLLTALSPLTGLERMVSTFAGCTSLTTVPAAFFDSCRKLTSAEGIFMNCTGLSDYTEMPATWKKP